jgi:hypothetical protein
MIFLKYMIHLSRKVFAQEFRQRHSAKKLHGRQVSGCERKGRERVQLGAQASCLPARGTASQPIGPQAISWGSHDSRLRRSLQAGCLRSQL